MSVCRKCEHRKNSAYHHLACPVQCLGWGVHDAAHLGKDVVLFTADELSHGIRAVLDPVHHFGIDGRAGSRTVGLSRAKARKMLHDGTVRGRPITERQRRFFGWVAGGRKQPVGLRAPSVDGPIHAFNEAEEALANEDYRRELDTTGSQQIVLMSIRREDRGVAYETHGETTQTLRVFSGTGQLLVDWRKTELAPGVVAVIPPGAHHRVRQTGRAPLKLSSTYVPPEHPVGLVQQRNPDTAKWELE